MTRRRKLALGLVICASGVALYLLFQPPPPGDEALIRDRVEAQLDAVRALAANTFLAGVDDPYRDNLGNDSRENLEVLLKGLAWRYRRDVIGVTLDRCEVTIEAPRERAHVALDVTVSRRKRDRAAAGDPIPYRFEVWLRYVDDWRVTRIHRVPRAR